MQQTIRERLGKAAYEARRAVINADGVTTLPPWNYAEEHIKELDRQEAEAVIYTLFEMLIPVFTNVLFTPEQVEAFLAKTLEGSKEE